jgi:hypothetical protein
MDCRVAYTLSVLLESEVVDGLPVAYEQTSPVPGTKPMVCITPSGFFDAAYGTRESLPQTPLLSIEDVPLLFGVPTIEWHGSTLVVKGDVIASAYFLLTRYEEVVSRSVRDEHGRFPGRESLPVRAGFLHRPIVDEYAVLLRKWVRQVGVELPAPKRRFSVLLTHDVDSLGPKPDLVLAARRVAGGLLGRRPWRKALADATVAAGLRRHPCDNLDEVAQLDGRLTERRRRERCRSVYFFMAGGNSAYDGDCDLRDARTRARLRKVSASGTGIGLHASYQAGGDPIRVGRERLALQKTAGVPIEKNRHHYLDWREPEDGDMIAAGGIRWDTTLGYADVAGFRLGVCRPVPLFDPIRQRLTGIEEHPLIVMDCTLHLAKYMNLDEGAAFDCVCRLADVTLRHQGEFVCLWHNTWLATTDTSYHKRLYPRVLDYLAGLLDRDSGTKQSGGSGYAEWSGSQEPAPW